MADTWLEPKDIIVSGRYLFVRKDDDPDHMPVIPFIEIVEWRGKLVAENDKTHQPIYEYDEECAFFGPIPNLL